MRDQIQRKVKRTDGPNDTDRYSHRVCDLCVAARRGSDRNHFTGQFASLDSGESKRSGSSVGFHIAVLMGLAASWQ